MSDLTPMLRTVAILGGTMLDSEALHVSMAGFGRVGRLAAGVLCAGEAQRF